MERGALPLVTAAIFMWIVGPISERPFLIPSLSLTWAAALWLGVLGSGLAMLMFYYVLHEINGEGVQVVLARFTVTARGQLLRFEPLETARRLAASDDPPAAKRFMHFERLTASTVKILGH